MATNVTPEYKDAEARYKKATTDEEKLAALEEMGATLNKHKATEKLYADIKTRIRELRETIEEKPKKKAFAVRVEREGAAQVVLVGAPNTGKSSLLARLTKARPEIGDFAFTTRAPLPGMAYHEDVALQLVDLPPLAAEITESWVYGLVRNADAAVLVVDLAGDPLGDAECALALLLENKILLRRAGAAAPDDPRLAVLPAILVGTHADADAGALDVVRELFPGFPAAAVAVGAEAPPPLAVTALLFALLDLVRVYSKTPGKDADRSRPYVLHRGATVVDFAARVHREIADKLAYARLWAAGKPEGIRVPRDYVVADGDVIELHSAVHAGA